jgi:hypothetical protein
MTWEQYWTGLAVIAAVVGLVLGVYSLVRPKKMRTEEEADCDVCRQEAEADCD